VVLPPEFQGKPTASTVLVKVSAAGYPLEVRGLRPSSDSAFEKLAREYVAQAEWSPATRGGRAMDGWTAWTVVPTR
jgi:outer membrane biosynthesis protein TonB